jgi:hypothetical protein
MSATFLPRRCATERGDCSRVRPFSVARIMLYGFCVPDRLRHHVLDAQHLEHGPHRAAGDDPGAFRRRAHHHLARAVAACDVVMQRAAFAQRHPNHLPFGLLGRLSDRFGHFLGLALAEANATLLVTDHDEGRKSEALAALHGLGHPVDRHQAIGEFRGFSSRSRRPPRRLSRSAMRQSLSWRRESACHIDPGEHLGDAPGSSGWRKRHPHLFLVPHLDPKTGAHFSERGHA